MGQKKAFEEILANIPKSTDSRGPPYTKQDKYDTL